MSNRGLDAWSEGMTSRERVRAIATTLSEPRSVEWVREEARILSWQTAKDELEMLVECGQIQAIKGNDGSTKYAPDYQLRYLNEVTELINSHSREELREEIARIQETIDEWKADFDVKSRDELKSTLVEDGHSIEAVRERNMVLREWERHEENKRLLKHALEHSRGTQ